MTATEEADVAIVGGGPAGAALAIHLARAGVDVVVFERRAAPEWRACGVFSSPLTRSRLADLGFSSTEIGALQRPISALNLQTTRGVSCRIEYEHGFACGFDRVRLDTSLLERARDVGADVRLGTVVRSVQLPSDQAGPAQLHVSKTEESNDRRMSPNEPDEGGLGKSVVKARLVVGADGMTSIVGRSARVYARRPFLHRMGMTFHHADPSAQADGQPMEGRFVFGRNWYIGVAPVPGGRVNVGIVAPAAHRADLSPQALSQSLIGAMPRPADAWASQPTTDHVAVAGRLEHHVTRSSGRGYLLVGDAIEFIDPLTGEGLLRALTSAELAADAIAKLFRGDRSALEVYDRRIRARWRSKNVVSWILQAFLARPAAFDYALRRLATRRSLRSQLTLVLTDQQPATRALDPRFLARLLAP